MIPALLLTVFCTQEWKIAAEIELEGSPVGCSRELSGEYGVTVLTDSGLVDYRVIEGEGIVRRSPRDILAFPGISCVFTSELRENGLFEHGLACCYGMDTLWTADLGFSTYEGEFPGAVLPSADGGCYAVFSPEMTTGAWRAVRIDPSGEEAFDSNFQLFGGPVISVTDMAELPDGGLVITGVTDSRGMNLSMFLKGFSGTGGLLFDISDSLRFHASGGIVIADSHGIALAGYTGEEREDGFFLPPIETDVFLMLFDRDGSERWRTVTELPGENHPLAMSISPDGSVVMAVSSFSHEAYDQRTIYLLDFAGSSPDDERSWHE